MCRCPVLQQGTSFDIDDDERFAGLLHGIQQHLLFLRQVEGGTIEALAAVGFSADGGSRLLVLCSCIAAAAASDDGDDDICLLNLRRQAMTLFEGAADGDDLRVGLGGRVVAELGIAVVGVGTTDIYARTFI